MKILQFLHTAILVSDLDKAKQFYGTVLGLSPAERNLNFSGAWYQIGDYQIHLIVNPEFENNLYNTEKWGRNTHIAFSVDDLEALKERLHEHHYAIQSSSSGRAAIFVRDPDSNIIEINQI